MTVTQNTHGTWDVLDDDGQVLATFTRRVAAWRWFVMLRFSAEGDVYYAPWMARLGLPMIPLWWVNWFFDLQYRLGLRGDGHD